MRVFLIVLLAGLFTLSGVAGAQAKNVWQTYPEWFACVENSQCIMACEKCGGVSTNLEFTDKLTLVRPTCKQPDPCFSFAGAARCIHNECISFTDLERR